MSGVVRSLTGALSAPRGIDGTHRDRIDEVGIESADRDRLLMVPHVEKRSERRRMGTIGRMGFRQKKSEMRPFRNHGGVGSGRPVVRLYGFCRHMNSGFVGSVMPNPPSPSAGNVIPIRYRLVQIDPAERNTSEQSDNRRARRLKRKDNIECATLEKDTARRCAPPSGCSQAEIG